MQHQFPYTFEFKHYDGEMSNITILVGHEKTRRGKAVIRYKLDWNHGYNTALELPSLPADTDSMDRCRLFWSAMELTVLRAIFYHPHPWIEDTLDEIERDEVEGLILEKAIQELLDQTPNMVAHQNSTIDNFLKKLPASLQMRRINNGW